MPKNKTTTVEEIITDEKTTADEKITDKEPTADEKITDKEPITSSGESAKKVKKNKTIILPRDPLKTGEGTDQEFFSVNFKNYLIKVDEPVEVPVEVADVIENVAKARREAATYANKMKFKDAQPPT